MGIVSTKEILSRNTNFLFSVSSLLLIWTRLIKQSLRETNITDLGRRKSKKEMTKKAQTGTNENIDDFEYIFSK